jgi:hypothetical protein
VIFSSTLRKLTSRKRPPVRQKSPRYRGTLLLVAFAQHADQRQRGDGDDGGAKGAQQNTADSVVRSAESLVKNGSMAQNGIFTRV